MHLTPPQVTLGYSTTTGKLYGVHIYNKNRLIKMYKRFGKQLQANCMWKTLLGVVEADCLTPSHSKQVWLPPPTPPGAELATGVVAAMSNRCRRLCAAQPNPRGALYGSAV